MSGECRHSLARSEELDTDEQPRASLRDERDHGVPLATVGAAACEKPHSALDRCTPDEVYFDRLTDGNGVDVRGQFA